MKRAIYISEIRKFIANDELVKAVDLLMRLVDEQNSKRMNKVTILSMESTSLQDALWAEQILWSEGMKMKKKIASQMLEILTNIEWEAALEEDDKTDALPERKKKYLNSTDLLRA